MSERKQIQLTKEQIELAAQLTPLQRKYVINLVSGSMSQREAYLAAGGKAKTSNAQDQSASQILTHRMVKAFYESLLNSMAESSIMTREEALERLSKTARATIHDICTFKQVEVKTVNKDGDEVTEFNTIWTMKETDEIDPVIAAAIKSVTFTKSGPKIEMYDANGSIKILSDMQGWNAPKESKISGEVAVTEIVRKVVD